ncbi:hypothetical protein [Maribacter aestuarii]|uniref:hypothetical protein n=1 Tax=Maribacter aestuarii TaxID=1130723 RepID=UPI00248B216D|nr:hypothetical protein [Maribacter aestuarii]
MKIIPENKIELYLKLGRKLSCFVKVDSYFESRTCDWIKLEKYDSNYKATLVRSFDEGDEFFNDVLKFETVNELDGEVEFIEGDIQTIKKWVFENYNLKMDGFYQMNDLKIKYMELVKEKNWEVNLMMNIFKTKNENNNNYCNIAIKSKL